MSAARWSRFLMAGVAALVISKPARADGIETSVRQLTDASYKIRLSAALVLAKSHDPRAIIALADELDRDEEPTLRRVAALALGKMIDAHTPDDAVSLAFDALDVAATTDGDTKVRDTANKARTTLAPFRRKKVATAAAHTDKPEVFVNVDSATDQSKVAPSDASDRLTRVVKRHVERTGYATSWPGGLPTQTELTANHSRAFIVASTVKKIELSKVGHQTEIACKVEIRLAPWTGTDGGEHWEANRAASASGSAKAVTGNSDREIQGGMRDCVEAVAEDITARQVVPFLKHLATPGS
jgi:hypothetical protein